MTGGSSSTEIDRAVEVLRGGGLVAFPTETVYGLGADAGNPRAVSRVFAAKGRPPGHPLIVHLASVDQLDDWAVDVPAEARSLAEAFWPGPLTLILNRSGLVADEVTGGRSTVALRVPSHPVAGAFLSSFGGGVAAPSANRFGKVSPTTAGHVVADLGDAVDMVLDGGPSSVGIESTIVDLSIGRPEVVRLGAVTERELAEVIGGEVLLWEGLREGGAEEEGSEASGDGREVAAPGTLAAHYAPAARVELAGFDRVIERASACLREGASVGVLAPEPLAGLPDAVVQLAPAGDPEHYASVLYLRFREADLLGLEILVVVPPPAAGIGRAVLDRLRRASASHR